MWSGKHRALALLEECVVNNPQSTEQVTICIYGWASPNNPTAQPHLGRGIFANTGTQVKMIMLIEPIRET